MVLKSCNINIGKFLKFILVWSNPVKLHVALSMLRFSRYNVIDRLF